MPIKETWVYISPDKSNYPLDVDGKRSVVSYEGTGMPPIKYITQRGVFQHGNNVSSYRLEPRLVQLIIRHSYCNRDEYWNGRAALLDILRPNRMAAPGTLRKIRSDGSKRDLDVYIDEGPKFVNGESGIWDEWGFIETLRFIAANPVVYDPTVHTALWTVPPLTEGLVFPATFPILFGTYLYNVSVTVTYLGNWPEYPIIQLFGPMTYPTIENLTTGKKIQLYYVIPTGSSATLDLSYGYKTILLNGGTNIIQYLSSDSDLTSFSLEPGINVLRVIADNAVGASVQMTYINRYVGY